MFFSLQKEEHQDFFSLQKETISNCFSAEKDNQQYLSSSACRATSCDVQGFINSHGVQPFFVLATRGDSTPCTYSPLSPHSPSAVPLRAC